MKDAFQKRSAELETQAGFKRAILAMEDRLQESERQNKKVKRELPRIASDNEVIELTDSDSE